MIQQLALLKKTNKTNIVVDLNFILKGITERNWASHYSVQRKHGLGALNVLQAHRSELRREGKQSCNSVKVPVSRSGGFLCFEIVAAFFTYMSKYINVVTASKHLIIRNSSC